jgi:hypothetical protein
MGNMKSLPPDGARYPYVGIDHGTEPPEAWRGEVVLVQDRDAFMKDLAWCLGDPEKRRRRHLRELRRIRRRKHGRR